MSETFPPIRTFGLAYWLTRPTRGPDHPEMLP